MDSLSVSVIDLSQPSSSTSVQDIKDIFCESEISVRLTIFEEKAPVPFSLKVSSHSLEQPVPDGLLIILPRDIGEIERSIIRTLSREPDRIPVIAVIEDIGTDQLMDLFRLGVVDFITPPIRAVDVLPRLCRLVEHAQKKKTLVERLKETVGLKQIIGTSKVLSAELEKIPFVAGCDSSVLISGETGTGKEMVTRAIHYLGPRSDMPFTPVNCGAIPPELIENELFGHARGAFTSAVASSNGIISETDRGTLFLDEIDCLTLAAQVKLLRFLQEKEYRQLGSAKTKRADVRIIAATNINLDEAVNHGRFRRDLYYRLNIIPLCLPPLRDRREDILLLARHFMKQYSLEFTKAVEGFSPEAEQKLLLYDWPGNVRELQNVIERGVIFSSSGILQTNDLNLPRTEASPTAESFQQAKARFVTEFEKNYIHSVLAAHGGNITQAAKTAGKNRRAFWELMRKHEISNGEFKHSE